MGDKEEDKSDPGEEKCWGIIVINEMGAGYVQTYKEGDVIEAYEFSETKFLEKNKQKKIKKLVEDINRKNLFIKVNELVLSTTEDYQDQLHQLDTLEVLLKKPTHLITLPEKSIGPIQETLKLLNIPLPVELASSVPMPRRGSGASTNSKTEEKATGIKASLYNLPRKKTNDLSQPQEITTGHGDPSTETKDPDSQKERDMYFYMKDIICKLDGNSQKIDRLVSVVNGLVTKIDTIEAKVSKLEGPKQHPTLNYSPLLKKVALPVPSKSTISGLPCYFHPAPVRVKQIQTQFSSKLKQKVHQEKLQILDNPSGPTVVFIVNSSRLISDIQRDLKSDTSNGPTFLLVIKATMQPDDLAERLEPRSMGFDRVKEAAFLLVDTNNTHLYDCTTNEESLNSVIQFLKDNKEGTRM